jgi:hypothetical protein
VLNAYLHRRFRHLLALAWALVAIGAVVLIAGYSTMPDSIVLYRPPCADNPTLGPKSVVTVGRIAWMGVGQLGAATAMCVASRGSAGWERFWCWLGLTAGAKTLLESVSFVLREESATQRAAIGSTFAVVFAFALTASWWWGRGELRAHPQLTGFPRIWLAASLALWAVCAIAPCFV